MMARANVLFGLHRDASLVKRNVTPAEIQLLVIMHMQNVGRNPVLAIELLEPVARSAREEITRLRAIYGTARVRTIYGPNSPLPATFGEAIDSGTAWAMEHSADDAEPLVGRRITTQEAAAFV